MSWLLSQIQSGFSSTLSSKYGHFWLQKQTKKTTKQDATSAIPTWLQNGTWNSPEIVLHVHEGCDVQFWMNYFFFLDWIFVEDLVSGAAELFRIKNSFCYLAFFVLNKVDKIIVNNLCITYTYSMVALWEM